MNAINDCVILSNNSTYALCIDDSDAFFFEGFDVEKCHFHSLLNDYITFDDGERVVSIFTGGTRLTKEAIKSAARITVISASDTPEAFLPILSLTNDMHKEQ